MGGSTAGLIAINCAPLLCIYSQPRFVNSSVCWFNSVTPPKPGMITIKFWCISHSDSSGWKHLKCIKCHKQGYQNQRNASSGGDHWTERVARSQNRAFRHSNRQAGKALEGNIRELKDEGSMEERHRARFCTRLEWLTVLLQCTEVSILVFAGLCGLPCSHTRVRAALITLPVCLLPLRQARSHLQGSTLGWHVCLMSAAILLKLFFCRKEWWKEGLKVTHQN